MEGVDEADIVKTDGEYLYVISGQKVFIIKAYPAEEATILSMIAVNGTLEQIFINEERLVLFYQEGFWSEARTFINVYDISDRSAPILKKETAADGDYFGSRMIGEHVYVVVTKGAWLYEGKTELPKILVNKEWKQIAATDIYYSSIVDYAYTYTTVLAVNVQQDDQEPTYAPLLLGYAANLYVSSENIYLAMCNGDRTILHRIHVEDGEIAYVADGEVRGRILNQFAMDEHEDFLRIATLSQIDSSRWTFAIMQVESNVYVLNMDLDVVGKLEGVAPGESIHSARFMGDKCYLVTFKKTDPFFVISLADPYDPEILGELKITGYSDYLHLYDESHVIGIGKETVEAMEGDFAWYQGIKMSLFDVSSVSEPEELARWEIGDRGTDSPILRDHKAFLFDRGRNLLVIPVAVAKINENEYSEGVPPYVSGNIVWQGGYVFTISLALEDKLQLRGTVTHIENGNAYDTSHYINRALYIGDVLYTVSASKVKMNSLSDLSEINHLNLSL